jgi:hypothetical protein
VFLLVYFLQVLYHEDGSVKGIATNDVGIHKDGSPKVFSGVLQPSLSAYFLYDLKHESIRNFGVETLFGMCHDCGMGALTVMFRIH